jgi:purine-binding chemotaxis protein CheW
MIAGCQPLATDQTADSVAELLSFTVAGCDFCLPVTDVREVRSWSDPTPLPLSDPSLIGVINLRGTILPVIDLARKLALPSTATPPGVIVVVARAGRLAGLAVDRVDNILTIPVSALSPPPALANSGIAAGLSGVILVNDGCLPVLDVTLLMPCQSRVQA